MASETTTEKAEAPPVVRTDGAPWRRNLRQPWRPGQSGNPKGRPSHRRLFEEALARAVTEKADAIVAALVNRALEGDARMMAALLDRLVPRINRHELDAASAPTKLVISWAGEPTLRNELLPEAKRTGHELGGL
jgi:hypothetical protein